MNDSWGSPLDITDALQAHFGRFTIDLAAEPWSAVVPTFVSEQQDLFKQTSLRVLNGYGNWPYSEGKLIRFMPYAREMVVKGQWKRVTQLVPHYTSEGWWRHITRPEGKIIGAEYNYGHIDHPKLREWTRYHYQGLVVDIIPVAGRLAFRVPPTWRGARETARFSSVIVRFVHPDGV